MDRIVRLPDNVASLEGAERSDGKHLSSFVFGPIRPALIADVPLAAPREA